MKPVKKPALVIMAAGMGSRYGGLKQIDPVGAHGELIIDYSIYDAVRAGFERVVFIIKREIEREFREVIGDRMEKNLEVVYAHQELNDLPPGFEVPEGRVKPWGTVQAILAAKNAVDGPFAVINADDYYGPSAFKTLFDWLRLPQAQDGKLHYAMVGYQLENTLSDQGGVTRGVCMEDANGFLAGVTERSGIERTAAGARYPDEGGQWVEAPAGTLVSMNFWGLNEGFMPVAERAFADFLAKNLSTNPLKCELVVPTEIDRQVRQGTADVAVLRSGDVWYGMTYHEDHQVVADAMAKKHREGLYPTPLWS